MKLEEYLIKAINEESDKLILRHHEYHNALHLEYIRNTKRIQSPPKKIVKTPDYWKIDKKFNPFYVKRKSKSIARAIAKKIFEHRYSPNPPYNKVIAKPGGGTRSVVVYQIPDAAVSNIYYSRLLAKNKHRFSSFSYAYRNDRNAHYAIQDIWLDFSSNARLFLAEFDFSDFFGSISHEYLKSQYRCNGFFISKEEERVIAAFLEGRDVGIPQGTSISLFLANLVCWRLDRGLERAGLKFARYADDTVIWSPNYQTICEAFTVINRFSSDAGIPINSKKSTGISLLTKEGFPSELASTKSSIDFLGYTASNKSIAIKNGSIKKIKKQISYLLYRNLIQPLHGGVLQGLIIPANNKDEALLTSMMQIRRYIYGGLSAQQLRNYIMGKTKRIYFKGIMSYYPLVNDEEQMRKLDGWLVSVIYRALQLRSKLLQKWNYNRSGSFPFNVKREEIPKQFRKHKVNRRSLLEVPSFMLIHKALQLGLVNRGIDNVMNPESKDYDY